MLAGDTRKIDLGRLAPGLSRTCDDYLEAYRARLVARLKDGARGSALAREHARILDGLVGALYCAADAASLADGRARKGRIALVAVGGWGRARVGIHSDVDALFLCDDPDDPRVAALAEAVLYPLWDLGLQVGHVVRSVKDTLELARGDVRTATTLLDLRRVAGDASVVRDLVQQSAKSVFASSMNSFLDAMVQDTSARHQRFGDSLYLLEPEVKLGRGGLRDLDVALWSLGARFGANSVDAFHEAGTMLPREYSDLVAAEDFLWSVRNLLHQRAGRRHDRITFEDQEELSSTLSFSDSATLGVEQFMQTYYRHARNVAQLSERFIERARPRKKRFLGSSERVVADGILLRDGAMCFQNPKALDSDPALAMRFYDAVATQSVAPAADAREAIMHAAASDSWRERLRSEPVANNIFLRLVSHVGEAPVRRGSMLAELHETGLLLSMIPEFESVTGRVQHDVYHVYTVDVHSVAAVDRLRAIARGELAESLPTPSSLAADAVRPVPLYLAVLLHDIGKAKGKDHSVRGAEMAASIGPRLGLSPLDVEHVVWLVREHLSLYHWAMRRDTSDPDTIREVAKLVGSVDRLRDLYLLTVADLSTTNPNAMTAWKGSMLDTLYAAVAESLEGETTHSPEERAEQIRSEFQARCDSSPAGVARQRFLQSMPARYILSNPVSAMLRHAELATQRAHARVCLDAVSYPGGDVELVIVADDKPGRLAELAAALTANRLGVIAAQIYTRVRDDGHAEAFDIFRVRKVRGAAVDTLSWKTKLLGDLEAMVTGQTSAEDLLKARPKAPAWATRKAPTVRTEVHVDNAVSPRFTVIDVYTHDRVGVLHAIARSIHELGLQIAVSKINTEGARVADVFYVTDAAGMKVTDVSLVNAIKSRLRETLQDLAEELGASTAYEGETS